MTTLNHITLSRSGVILITAVSLSLTACVGGGAAYTPIVDGPVSAEYFSDLSACQSVAKQRNYNNADSRTDALIGAGLGGLVGLAEADDHGGDSDFGDFLGGALVGGLIGGGARALETRDERKSIVMNCMAGRGHRVVG